VDATLPDYVPTDRLRATSAPVLLGGVAAIARLLVEQRERDACSGLSTAAFVSGYPGSPLGGVEAMLASSPDLVGRPDVHHVAAVNEEIAATAVWGSQQPLPALETSFDGTIGVWYGKSPGIDRCGDPLRNGNLFGAHPRGGVLVLVGDDPAPKSSTVPSASEATLAAFGLPVLYPRDSEQVVEHGLLGIALSRASGCFVALKITTDVADGARSVARDFSLLEIAVPTVEWEGQPWAFRQAMPPGPPAAVGAERELAGPRWEMIHAFARANRLNAVEIDAPDAWLGIVAGGKTCDDTLQALADLGLDRETLVRRGIRVLRVGMLNPLERESVREFAHGLETVLVVEEKQPFLETRVRDALYGTARAPAVLGKRDREGLPLVPADGDLPAPRLAPILRTLLAPRVEVRDLPAPPGLSLAPLPLRRRPYFCSGCPHNRSTVVPEGSLAGGGIGCHGLVGMMERKESEVTGLTHMGGEGAQWIGQAFLHDGGHIFQNVGDGTFFHSAQLCLQACVAAGVDITFKLLYNSTIAMTGGQDAAGAVSVPELTRKLAAEGVRRTIVLTDELRRYRGVALSDNAVAWDRSRLDEAQRELRETSGVTVLIYDQMCANQLRRLRKRGKAPVRTMRVLINPEVCEGCGDCGHKSNCLSVQPLETELGTKRRIDQTSCNTDYSCLDGDCPSFVTVDIDPSARRLVDTPTPPAVDEPAGAGPEGTFNVLFTGVGGTGIVTVNQVLATAALLDGMQVSTLDQTGMSQKAGPVLSHLRLGRGVIEPANRVGHGQADCYLALDVLTGSEASTLAYAHPGRTASFVSTTEVPTGAMVEGSYAGGFPAREDLLARIAVSSREVFDLDTFAAAEALFGHTTPSHFLLIGAAYQSGALPITAEAIERAIELNGVGVADNIAAFRWGRVAIADPAAFTGAITRKDGRTLPVDPLPGSPLAGATRATAAVRVPQLEAYGGRPLARSYLAAVEAAWQAERSVTDRTDFSEAVASGLHRALAYKDEYEVARLLTAPDFLASIDEELPGVRRVRYRLHPPVLRSLGLKQKIGLDARVATPFLRTLARLRALRGTPFDPFGYAHVRKVERALAREHAELCASLTATLDADGYDHAVAAARAIELVKGYEEIKLENLERYRERLGELGVRAAER
jgi:indolepyruvate ferredoxin oxidoreductase